MPKDVLDQLGSLTLEKDHFLVNINTYSKLAPEVWSDYVSDMLSGAPLRACTELCRVSLKTSWFLRMRLYEVMRRAAQAGHGLPRSRAAGNLSMVNALHQRLKHFLRC